MQVYRSLLPALLALLKSLAFATESDNLILLLFDCSTQYSYFDVFSRAPMIIT